MNLKQAMVACYQKRYERENLYQTCEPYFFRLIGVEQEAEYCDLLKTLEGYLSVHSKITVFFEGLIPVPADFALIEGVKQELLNMNVFQLSTQEITIFEQPERNQVFLNALETVVNLALQQESFFSEYTRNDFIAKLIVWAYQYLTPLDFEDHYLPKCIYYGELDRHAVYFLMLAYHMGIDVLYLNPLKEAWFEELDSQNWSRKVQAMGLLPIETFGFYAKQGQRLLQIETTTKRIQQEFHDQFFDNTGIFKPWQFRSGTTHALTMDTILEDLFVYWNEQARMRQGFRVSGMTVDVPCFFQKIDGVYTDRLKYKRLVEHCSTSTYTLFFNSGTFTSAPLIENEMYQLPFCQLSDGTFHLDELKKLSFYRWGKYSEEVQLFMLQKLNEVIQSDQLFLEPLKNETLLKLCYRVLTLEERIIRAIDNFDFPGDVPKLVIYLDQEERMPNEQVQLLAYLNRIGWDIVIFNPSGLFNLGETLQSNVFSVKRLETMDYELTYEQVMKVKTGFFSKFRK